MASEGDILLFIDAERHSEPFAADLGGADWVISMSTSPACNATGYPVARLNL